MVNNNDLYWAAEKLPPDLALPKRKQVQLEEESLDNTVSMIKSGMSTKKTHKSALKTTNTKDGKKAEPSNANSLMIATQATSISQLTKQVNEIKQMNKMFLTCFDQLAKQMAALLATNINPSHNQNPARGHTTKTQPAVTQVDLAEQHEARVQCRWR